jgi:hypothetical protein
MLGAPPAVAPADNMTIDRGVHGTAANLGTGSASNAVAQPVSAGEPSDDFAAQREQAADDLLAAPQGPASGLTSADGPTHGGPQD